MKKWLSCTAMALLAAAVFFASQWFEIEREPSFATPLESRKLVLDRAETLDARHEFEVAIETLRAGQSLPGTDADLAEILRREARIQWKVFEKHIQARELLRTAYELRVEQTATVVEVSRLERNRGDFVAAIAAAQKAKASAHSEGDWYDATVAYATAEVESAVNNVLARQSFDSTRIESANIALAALLTERGGTPSTAQVLLRGALLSGDGPTALAMTHSYYFLPAGSEPPSAIAKGVISLRENLPRWTPDATELSSLETIVSGFADARLFTEAAIVALNAPPPIRRELVSRPQIAEVLAYRKFCETVGQHMIRHYRLAARGEGSTSLYWEGFNNAIADLWPQLARATSSVPTYSGNESARSKSLERELNPRFGTVVRFVNIDGFRGLQMGHIVKDERHQVEQYGNSATVRFVVLDSMVSNGFASWAWNSGAQHGGWTGSERIVQVRPPYTAKPFGVWRRLTWKKEREERKREVERETEEDDQRATTNPTGYFSGLAMRIHDQGAAALLDELRASGLNGSELQIAFLSSYANAVEQSSIYAHEGRHLIDRLDRWLPVPSWRKEYNAKLSEVAFAPHPRLALGAIISSNTGDGGAHGKANAKIMTGILSWIRSNKSQISRLDESKPLLPQFDRLSDDQIREVFRSMDSLAD